MTKSNTDDLPDFPLPPDEHNGGAPGDDKDNGDIESACAKPMDFSDVTIGIKSAAQEFDSSSKRFAKSADSQATAILGLSDAVAALNDSIKAMRGPAAKPSDPSLTAGLENPRQPDATAGAFSAQATPGITEAKPSKPFEPSIRDSDPAMQPSLVTGPEHGRDSVPAMLKPGEFVMRPEAVRAIGVKHLEEANNNLTRPENHATGGRVRNFAMGGVTAGGLAGAAGAMATHPAHASVANYAVQSMNTPTNAGTGAGILSSVAQGPMAGGASGGLYGAAVGAAISGLNAVGAAAKTSAASIGKYNAAMSVSNAKAITRQIQGDINRAQSIGTSVSGYTDVTSKLGESAQNLQAAVLKAALDQMVPALEMLLEYVEKYGAQAVEGFAGVITTGADILASIPLVGAIAKGAAVYARETAQNLKEINDRQKKNAPIGMDVFMKDFLLGGGGMNEQKANNRVLTVGEDAAREYHKNVMAGW